jgi:hypothetical protein
VGGGLLSKEVNNVLRSAASYCVFDAGPVYRHLVRLEAEEEDGRGTTLTLCCAEAALTTAPTDLAVDHFGCAAGKGEVRKK